VVTQFSKMDVTTSYKTLTIAALIQGFSTLAVIYALYFLFCL